MEHTLQPLNRPATLGDLEHAWGVPYHSLYRAVTALGFHNPTRGSRTATLFLPIDKQRHLAESLSKSRVFRPSEIEKLSAEDTRAALLDISTRLDRLTKQIERRDALLEAKGQWNATLSKHLDALDGPDSAEARHLLAVCANPLDASPEALGEASMFLALLLGTKARKEEGDDASYLAGVAKIASQPDGLVVGALSGQLYGLMQTVQAAVQMHAEGAERLAPILTVVFKQLATLAGDGYTWMEQHAQDVPA